MNHDLLHRFFGWFGYGGAGGVFAMSAAETELAIRIVVGLLSIASIIIHFCWSYADRRQKARKPRKGPK